MGSGCSSPLRRFGGKKSKPSRRESSLTEGSIGGERGNQDGGPQLQQPQKHRLSTAQKLALDNEITIQSEVNEDHPSSASYYTDVKNHNEETKVSDLSGNLDQKHTNETLMDKGSAFKKGGVVARMIGLNGTYVPHDRHLLVSPALSPAPSTCYSPSPASSTPAGLSIDLNDLNEAFKTLTFGMSNDHINNKKRIRQPDRQQSTEMHNYYTQQLVQSQNDLINSISVIFITADSFQLNTANEQPVKQSNTTQHNTIGILANHLESNLKSFCDEHIFNLRFFNLSHMHLCEHFQINNLLDASKKVFEQVYYNNRQRTVVVVLSNTSASGSIETSTMSANLQSQPLDKRQLPTKIAAQSMSKLQNIVLDEKAKDLLKKWYNQVGDIHFLRPIYLVYPKILSKSNEERDQAWHNWVIESTSIIAAIDSTHDIDPELYSNIELKSIFGSYIDFIMTEPALQKRTLLIRNHSQPSSSGIMSNQQQQQSISGQSKFGSLNELARLLADPNKMTLKRSVSYEEFLKIVCDWVNENFGKIVESIQENQLTQGKHVPPFIERNLFTELTCQRHQLEYYLDNITETFEAKCYSFYINQISPILEGVVNCANPILDAHLNDDYSPENQTSTNHLVFISGPKGCGKSTLFSQMIRYTAQDLFNKAQIIYRFSDISLDSLSPGRMLRSICEQFCQTQGENITAASYVYSSRGEIMNALNKIINQQSSLIFIDGLDTFAKSKGDLDLDWICEIKANPRIKLIIMLETDSMLYKKYLTAFSDATYISLDNPSISEWAQMLTSTARSRRFNSVGNLYDEIKKQGELEAKDPALTYREVNDIIHMCRIRQLNNESHFPELTIQNIQNNPLEHLKKMQQVALSHIHYLLKPYHLGALIVALDSSRNGISEPDIINIMTLISQKDTFRSDHKFSATLLSYLKIQLKPWLLYIMCDKTSKIAIRREFAAQAIEYYEANFYPNIVNDVREVLLDYFDFQAKRKTSKSNLYKGGGDNLTEPREIVSSNERPCLATRASEVMNLLILTNPSKARDYILNKQQFFLQFLYGSMPEEFIEDCERLKESCSKKSANMEDIQNLVGYIKQSIYPLRYEGSQIYSQIYCRAYETIKAGKLSKNKKLHEILITATCPPIRNLLPVSEASINSFIKARIGQNSNVQTPSSTLSTQAAVSQKMCKASVYSNSQSTGQVQSKQKIFTIKDNHRHVIAIYPDKSSISVWDIYEEKAVRTINNLDQPRDLKMIDQKRAVILCNRELKVYDLDTGMMLTKLKGVMNQKMPFFEVFGDNYVVALARNRMYVNMLNLNTGELETTFKVGEDRFLNSLLVSADGGICVCGDETQKPFPLLVWNLNERRLMYDLRLERHEFITRMSAISDDGHFVVSVCKQIENGESQQHGSSSTTASNSTSAHKTSPNFIVIYDLSSGTMFKKWKPGLDTCAVAIFLSANRVGKVINTIVDSSILVWDLATGSKKHTLTGHSAPADIIKVQNNRLFSMDSTCRDQSLRIWDIEEGYCLAVFSPDAPVNCCQISTRGDALICGFAAETRLSTLVMCKEETVSDVIKRNKRRKSSKSLYIFDEPPSRKSSS